MSLWLTKIIEGGVDLTTGRELTQGIVVTNGATEITIPVDPEDVQRIVLLYAQGESPSPREEFEAALGPVTSPKMTPAPPATRPTVLHPVEAPPAPGEQVVFEEPPVSTDTSDEEFEPGEEYNDGATGIGSL